MSRSRVLLLAATSLVLTLTPVLPLPGSGGPTAAAQANCASKTTRSISGTVFGQDNRDVNVSVGFDVVDANGRAINADPSQPGYGCAKTGGYSVKQAYLNHFVGPEGQPQASPMRDAQGRPQGTTTRAWRLANVPSNAKGVYIEVYHRGYTGSPCKDSQGNWCFNKQTLTKYGNANKHLVPIGTQNLPIRLPMTCPYQGTAGGIKGRITNAAGQPVQVKNLYAWTESKWNTSPFVHGWGIARFPSTGSYEVPALASRQKYVLWATTNSGRTYKKFGVQVNDCATTTLDWRL